MMNQAGDVPRLQNGKGFRFQPARDTNTISSRFPDKDFGKAVVICPMFN